MSVGPIVEKKQWKEKSTCSVREEAAFPKREQDEELERQPVVQQSSHNNGRGKIQKSRTSQKPPAPYLSEL